MPLDGSASITRYASSHVPLQGGAMTMKLPSMIVTLRASGIYVRFLLL